MVLFRHAKKIQDLVFPKGVSYDKEEGVYRTPAVNSVLSVFSDISGDYKEYINKKESQFCDSFSFVEHPIELSNKFIEDWKNTLNLFRNIQS